MLYLEFPVKTPQKLQIGIAEMDLKYDSEKNFAKLAQL